MARAVAPQIRISVAIQARPDGTYLLTSDMDVAPEEVKSIEDALETIDGWAKIRLSQNDAKGAEIVVDLSYPALSFHWVDE